MHYLLLGDDTLAKDKKILEIKKKFFPSPEAFSFDYELLHGHKLEPDTLKKALITLPVIAPQRLILIRQVSKLTAANKQLILDFLRNKQPHAILVLDSDEGEDRDAFTSQLTKNCQVFRFGEGVKQNVFDMTKAVALRKPIEALSILANLFSQGTQPLQIMGGIVWFWGKNKGRLSKVKFRQGLLALQEADINIKRTRLKPEHALEILVVKLCSLLAY